MKAVSHDALAAQKPLRFLPPMIELSTDVGGFSYWWGMTEFAFDIRDRLRHTRPPSTYETPRSFPPMPVGTFEANELARLKRYVKKAEDLAVSTIMSASDEVTINIGDGGTTEEVTTKSSPVDATTGFATMFRQFYANDKGSSFNAVQGILMRQAKTLGGEDADERIEELRRWGKAIGKSRSQSVEKSVLLKLIECDEMPPLPEHELAQYPDQETPEKLSSTYFYGDHIHWSSKEGQAEVLAEGGESPFERLSADAMARLSAEDRIRFRPDPSWFFGHAVRNTTIRMLADADPWTAENLDAQTAETAASLARVPLPNREWLGPVSDPWLLSWEEIDPLLMCGLAALADQSDGDDMLVADADLRNVVETAASSEHELLRRPATPLAERLAL